MLGCRHLLESGVFVLELRLGLEIFELLTGIQAYGVLGLRTSGLWFRPKG